jgi:hypothetical protein
VAHGLGALTAGGAERCARVIRALPMRFSRVFPSRRAATGSKGERVRRGSRPVAKPSTICYSRARVKQIEPDQTTRSRIVSDRWEGRAYGGGPPYVSDPKRSGYAARLARTLLVASGSLGGTLASPRRESGLSGAASANPRIAHVAKVPRRHHAASGEIGEKWRKATRRCAREEFKNLGSRSEPQPEIDSLSIGGCCGSEILDPRGANRLIGTARCDRSVRG